MAALTYPRGQIAETLVTTRRDVTAMTEEEREALRAVTVYLACVGTNAEDIRARIEHGREMLARIRAAKAEKPSEAS